MAAMRPVNELAVVTRDRRRVLLTVLPVVALACAVGTGVVVRGPLAHGYDPFLFGGTAVLLLAVWLALIRRRLSYWPAAAITLIATGGMVLGRMMSLFTGPYFDDPHISLLNSIYAYFPAFFTLLTMLLPYPRSARWGAVAWLIVASFTTVMSAPFWSAPTPREGLPNLLTLVWFGYPIFLLLVAAAARRHTRMVRLYADVAAAAEAANGRAQESASRFAGIFNQAAVGIALLDAGGRWLQVNPRICEITGYAAGELTSRDSQSITHPDDLARDLAQADRLRRREIQTYAIEKRYVHKAGHHVWVKSHVSHLPGSAAEQDRFVVAVEDISQRKAAEERLSALHGQLEQRIDLRTRELRASNERWQTQSSRLKLVTELSSLLASAADESAACSIAAQYLPRIFADTVGTVHLADARGDYALAVQWGNARTSQDGPASRQIRASLVANGQIIGTIGVAYPAAPGDADSKPAADESILGTVSEQLALALINTRLRAELRTQAIRDALTGLYNRRYLNEALPRAIAAARRTRAPMALLVMDVDHFKRFNDSFGHESGDAVLAEVAGVLARSVREGDMAFRHGGEEFAAVLPSATQAEAVACAERIRREVSRLRLTVGGRALPPITLSVGLASVTDVPGGMDQLLAAADAALYRAKSEGRNCVRQLKRAA